MNLGALAQELKEYLNTDQFIIRNGIDYKIVGESTWHPVIELPFYASLFLPTITDVNRERDRRLALPFEYLGRMFDRDEKSLARITGAATLAGFIMSTQQEQAFQWITSDNNIVNFTAAEMFGLGQAAASIEADIIFAARRIKDMPNIPEDYQQDHYWSVL